MLDILHFIFSSFWVWAGTAVLLSILGGVVVGMVDAARGQRGGDER